MSEPVIVSAVRTAIGRFRGSLKDVHSADLGSTVAKAALERAGIEPASIDEIIVSETYRGDLPGCSARPVGLRAGLPIEVPGANVNMHCGSGLKALVWASQAIRAGDADTVLVVAMESMSRAAFLLRGARNGFPLGHAVLVDQLVQKGDPAKDPGVDPTARLSMGETAEEVASRYAITREAQDAYALESQRRAGVALAGKRFDGQIVPVMVPGGKSGPVPFSVDEHARPDTTPEALARLKPVFRAGGTVTAGNSSGMNDGAAGLVVMASDRAAALGLEPLARITGHAEVGLDPEVMGLGPVPATKKLLARTGYRIEDFRVIELNEAFAAQVLGCFALWPELAARRDCINVNGSGIALGHPIGATGAIITVKAVHELGRIGGGAALLTMCIGGGQGIAMSIESPPKH